MMICDNCGNKITDKLYYEKRLIGVEPAIITHYHRKCEGKEIIADDWIDREPVTAGLKHGQLGQS